MHWSEPEQRNALNFSRALKRAGFDFFTGVPCSLLGALIEKLSEQKGARYLPAVREDAAIGMASGAYLAGRLPCVLMQNSGIGYSLNVLTSLNLIYKIPVLCLVSYRGLGPDAPEHLVMGKSCERLLGEIGIPALVPDAAELPVALDQASAFMAREKIPFAILIKKGIFGG